MIDSVSDLVRRLDPDMVKTRVINARCSNEEILRQTDDRLLCIPIGVLIVSKITNKYNNISDVRLLRTFIFKPWYIR
jgi:hypothetical protein